MHLFRVCLLPKEGKHLESRDFISGLLTAESPSTFLVHSGDSVYSMWWHKCFRHILGSQQESKPFNTLIISVPVNQPGGYLVSFVIFHLPSVYLSIQQAIPSLTVPQHGNSTSCGLHIMLGAAGYKNESCSDDPQGISVSWERER